MTGKFQFPFGKGTGKDAGKKAPAGGGAISGLAEPLNHEQARIQEWLKQVSFKRVNFGGVEEADVWKKIAELNTLYEAALSAERARYDALLAERTGPAGQKGAGSAEHGRGGDEYNSG